jgi:WD40 repeat protein/tRNA A-37 threonylcarbamoyl transferase component Bud32
MSRADPSHPSREELAAFLDGRLSRAELDALEPHISACEECCAVLVQLPTDPLAQKLRTAGAEPATPDDLVDHPRYRLLEPLGSGGMGTVYKARHLLMDRVVALKVIHRRLLRNPRVVERFRLEAKAAARLAHPNIVTAYDAEHVGGCHFLVMEFLEGTSLAALVADRGPLPAAEACEYARQAALGLQHAHEHGMVHRDIKPQNLMLTPAGRVKVLDFGLAHITDEHEVGSGDTTEVAPAAALTHASTVLGTPDYMAPEQATDARAVDVRTDIYALGCTLYFLLTGRPPFPDGTPAAKQAAHRERAPQPLLDLPPGLARIVERTLAKEPAARFQTPAELAEALRPFAEPGRRRWRLALCATAAVVLLAAALVYWTTHDRSTPTGDDDPDFLSLPAELGLAGARIKAGLPRDPNDPEVVTLRDELIAYRERHPTATAAARLMARLAWPVDSLAPEKLPAAARAVVADGGDRAVPGELVAVFGGGRLTHWSRILCVAVSPDGKTIASGGVDNAVRVWDAATGDARHVLTAHTGDIVAVAFSPDGETLATAGTDGKLVLWDTATGRARQTLDSLCLAKSLAFAPDGRVLYAGHRNGGVTHWTVATGTVARTVPPSGSNDRPICLAVTPDGRTLAAGGLDGKVVLRDGVTGEPRATLWEHTTGIGAIAFAADGKTLAAAGGGKLMLWDVATRAGRVLAERDAGGGCLAFDPTGRTLASGNDALRLWDVKTGAASHTLVGHYHLVRGVAFGPGGTTLTSTSWDGSVKQWDVATGADRTPRRDGPTASLGGVAVSPDGRAVAAACQDGSVHVWDVATGEGKVVLRLTARIHRVAFRPDGKLLAAACHDGTVRLLDATRNWKERTFQAGQAVKDVAFSPNGNTLAAVGAKGQVQLWDLLGKGELKALAVPKGELLAVAFSPDGTTLAAAGDGGCVHFYDTATWSWRYGQWGDLPVTGLAFAPDGKTLASVAHGPDQRELIVWDVASGRLRIPAEPLVHEGAGLGVAYSPDGRTVASVGTDGVVRLWDPVAGRRSGAVVLGPARRDINGAAFTPDGRHLVTANSNGTAFVLRLEVLK